MGKRRRKLLRRKYQALPWNVYGKSSTTNTTQPEQKIIKVMEDNSVMIDRMKRISNTFDELIVALTEVDWADLEEEVIEEKPIVEMKAEPPVEMRIQPFNEPALIAPETPNFKKMTKRALTNYAKDNNITVKRTMTKNQLIKAIQETI
jgi:hypothetical protein